MDHATRIWNTRDSRGRREDQADGHGCTKNDLSHFPHLCQMKFAPFAEYGEVNIW
jgi:hypothetical protein